MSKWPRPVQQIVSSVATVLSVATAAWAGPDVKPEFVEKIEKALPDQAAAQPAKPRKLLVFYRTEGFVHGSIPTGNFALKRMGEKTGAYTADFSNEMTAFDAANLAQYDAVLFNNSTQLKFTNSVYRENLLNFMKQGKGLVGIHAASDSFYTWPEVSCMLGGQFDGHPWTAGHTVAVKNDDPDHPCNAAFCGKGFEIKDEIYQIKGCYSREKMRVLLSLDWANELNHKINTNQLRRADRDFGITWMKQDGGGRVFYCSLGHNDHIYWDPAILRHYLAGIQYALGDLKADDKPVARK